MGFQEEVRKAVGRAACNLVGPGVPGSFYDFTAIGLVFPEQLNAFREWVCDYPGNEEDKGSFRPGTSGLGGKCPVIYNGTLDQEFTFTSGGTQTITVSFGNILGPIEGIRVQIDSSNSSSIWIDHAGTTTRVRNENSSNRQYSDAIFKTIVRADGLPDDCGFVEPPIPPSWDDEIPDDDPVEPPRPINITPIIPIVLPGGGLSFPFNVNGPNFNFNTTLRIGGGGGGGGGGDCNPVQPVFGPSPTNTQPFGSEQIPEGPNEPPPPEEGEVGLIIGCYVSVVSRGDAAATVIGGTPGFPELLVPRVGDVSFAVTVEGKEAWTADVPVKFDKQWIPIPGRLLAYDVRIKPEPGVSALVFPLRVTSEYAQLAGFL